METQEEKDKLDQLPACAATYIKQVIKKMRYRRKVRQEVQAELVAHFEDEVKDCKTNEEKEQKAEQLIAEFGDAKLLAVLLRRAKKRCRPLWKKALLRTAKVIGIIFLYLVICTIPLMIGKPTIKVDYVQWLNESARAGRDEADNARAYYEKAVEIHQEMPNWLAVTTVDWPADFEDLELKSLTDWLENNKATIDMLRKAAECPYYWNHYQTIDGNEVEDIDLSQVIMPNIMEPLSDYRHLAQALGWQIQYEAYTGDVNQAMQDCFALVKFGNDMQGNGFLVEQLVGIAVEAMGIGVSFIILDNVDVSLEVLKNTQEKLEALFAKDKPVISLEGEKVFWYDIIQRWFTDDGKGDGRPFGRGLAYTVDSPWSLLRILLFDYPSRQETLATIERYFARSSELLAKTPWDLHNEGINDNNWADDIPNTSLMMDLLVPAYYQVSKTGWHLKTQRLGLLTVLALLRYQKENGQYPDELGQLVQASYLSQLPEDPYSEGPLTYVKAGVDFILYSAGENFRDDGGKLVINFLGIPKEWAEDGDAVFWPVQ